MIDKEILLESTELYLKSLISEVAQLAIGDNGMSTPFQELGVDSFRVLQIIRKLEEEFGTLPKTLLFENFNISDLSNYFVNKHEQTLVAKFANGIQMPATSARTTKGPLKPVEVISHTVANQAHKPLRKAPTIILEKDAQAHPELGEVVKKLFDQYKNEGSASRGTRIIAPNLFIGSEQKGYFNYSRSKNIILVYTYTGPKDYFPVIAAEMYQYCLSKNFEFNLFTSDQLESIGDSPFSATPFGVLSRIINIKDFSLQGNRMRRLRYQVSKFEDAGRCRTEEYHCGSNNDIDKSIADIIDQWCAPRTMVNPLIYIVKAEILAGSLDSQHRLFLTYLNDVLQNVILISKLSSEENGYLMDLEFYPESMPLGGLDFAIVGMMEILAAEGCDMLSLGGTYGCKLAPSSNADAELDKTLNYLREQNIFNDEGNLQFKNKFRPEHHTVFLCRPVGSNPDNVTDIIMMIADPTKMQTLDEENHTSFESHQPVASVEEKTQKHDTPYIIEEINQHVAPQQTEKQEVMIEGEERSIILSDFNYNPLNIPDSKVEFDLKTDSWAQLEIPAIQNQLRYLHTQLQQPVNLDGSLKSIFPFSHFALTTSGRTAEHAFFKSWSKKGIVLQNLLFPTTIFHQIENGFTPKELPHPEVFKLDSTELYKGDLTWEALQKQVEQDPKSIAFVLIEVNDNAAGGAAVSIQHLKKVKALLSKYSIPLVLDGTRVIENAQIIIENEKEFAGKNIWDVVREIFSCADAVITSLAKDFCVNKGGLIATNDVNLFNKLQDIIQEEGIGLDVIDKKVIALCLQNRNKIETQVLNRMESVRLIWNALKKNGIPVVQPVGGHCILIDVKQIPEFRLFEFPVASFVAWMFLNTGIRGGAHNAGMQKNTSINNLVRLAIPVGLKRKQVEEIASRLVNLFEQKINIPEVLLEGGISESFGDIHAKFELKKYHNVSGSVVPKIISTVSSSISHISTEKTSVSGSDLSSKEKELNPYASSKKSNQSRDIAIIGMAGRYPKAKSMSEFWDNLVQGKDCIETIPDVRFEQRLRNKFSEKYRGGFIDDVDKFDSLFFNISPREAEHLDPQERLFLEVAWETIEDAGYYPETLAEDDASRNIGVFVGAVWTLYQMLGVEEKIKGNNLNPSSHLWGIANRASYAFNLSGPSLSIDTACSSSLTAVYLACEAINNGECNGAIVGGVNLDVHQSKIDINNSGGALSNDGVCRTFGKGANGYVAGEGVGAIFIKPLDKAIKDGDNIYGVIKGIAVNHGGKTSGFMVPNPHAQAKVVVTALENAKIDARSIGYIEAHGTGTELGDPIEISGLTTAFQKYKVDKQGCSIGSVKTNIGHLEAAAGIVGIHKVLLQMKHKKLVPSLHSAELNPLIDFENSPFYVEQVAEDWKPKTVDGVQFPLRAGISSFGAGGANAHIIIEAYNATSSQKNSSADIKDRIFPLSAKNEDQLREVAIRMRSFIQKDLSSEPSIQLDLNDIAHTLRIGRKSFDYRLAIVAKTKEELVEKLTIYIEGKKDDTILAGQVKNGEGITRLLSRKEKEEFIKLLTQSGDLRKVAQLWVEGLLSDWQGIQVFDIGKKVSLSTYPFADKRHWISDTSKTAGLTLQSKIGIHPLIDSNESTFERQIFKKSFHNKDFFIYDHLVSGIPTLPGVAYLDFARKAGELAAGRKVQKIKNILWLSPLTVVNSKPTEAFIELKPNGDLVQFEVYSERENGQKQVHSQGKISYATAHDLEADEEFIDLESIRARCVKAMDGKDAYPHFKSLGLDLGPSFQVLQEVFQNQNEILGVLRIPEVRQGDFQDFLLHPSLIDGTGQTGMAAQLAENSNGGSGQMFVPYSFGEVEILHPVPQKCFAYVKKANDPNAKVTKTNILVVDESGKVVVKIKDSVGVPLVSVHEKPDHGASTNEFSKLYYSPVWEKSPLVIEKNTYDSILFFDTDEKLSSLYQARLKAAGKDLHQLVVVKPGNSFQDLGKKGYTINPQDPKDFTRLFESLKKTKFELGKICFAWSFDQNLQAIPEYNGELKASLIKGVYSFLFLCQALAEQKYKNTIQLLYLYLSEKEKLQPHHDAMNGFIKTLHIEHPKLSSKVLEIQAQKIDLGKILDSVLVEFGRDNQQEMTVRYEEGERYVRKLKEYKFEEIGSDSSAQALGLKEKGVYIIVGGAGGLGLIFAEYLAKEYKARLILTGRSELTGERKAKLEQLREMGAEVLYFEADIANAEDVKNLIKESKAKFGSINGIINSAGVLRDSYIRNKTSLEMDAVFAPKLYGSLHLDVATQNEDLDFFVMFSSMAAVGGNMGQCDYSFANNFMDSFAAQRENLKAKGKRSGKTLSLNWSIWADGGMRLDEQMEVFFKKNLGIVPLSIETGITAFTKALSIRESQLAVVEGVQEKIELAWGLRKEEPAVVISSSDSQQTVSSETSTPTADKDLIAMVQNELSQIVMEFLKLDADDISTDKILMDLGFDSIGLATFANAVNDKYKLDDVTPVLFFEYPSIKDIAKFLYTEHKHEMLQYHQSSRISTQTTVQTQKVEHVQEISLGFKKGWNPNAFDSITEPKTSGVKFSAERRFIDMPIAIVGMSGVMPQADDLDEYWEKLKNAENNMVTLVPEDRWKWEDYYGNPFEEKNKTKIKFGGFMREVDTFDPLFWGISPREAVMMDPQQRIFLETVWKAIEDSGHKVSDLSGTKTGIFVGAATRDYIDLMGSLEVELDGYSGSGTSHAVLANRVSYLLNLHGPSAPLDTACSSSLVALHRAIESIHTGSSDQAIVGGVQVMLTPAGHISFGAAGMLSEDGKCKTFDERANGYVRGEGSGAIFIKPLAKAEADGDHIYAVIKATAENHGGKVTVLTAPNPSKQAELLIEAYEKAEIDPTTVGYIECHGTGTSLGDPIEIQALKKAFAELYKRNNKGPVTKPHIGLTSAKTNIGHLETAAGIAGILKVLLSIRHGQIPALLHFEKLNPYIKLEGTPFYMVDKTRPWETIKNEDGVSLPRRAGVSSFGFGGANVHVILEEYISKIHSTNNFEGPYVIVLSAKNEERLKAYARLILANVKKQEIALPDFAYTLQVGRDAMTVRLGFTVNSVDELVEKLDAYIDGKNIENAYQGKVNNKGVDIDDNTINTWFSDKNNSKLLEAWSSGLDLDWNRLYDNAKPKRISLPTYPFAKEKYWFRASTTKQIDKTAATISVLHPLVHTNTSDLSRQSYSSTFSGEEFFIKDYQYKDQKILPAATYFEMARVAVDRATPALQKTNILELRNVVCENPIVINQNKQVTIALFADDQAQIEFEIFCADKDQEVVYCVGQAQFVNRAKPGSVAIQKLLGQMQQRNVGMDALYADFSKTGLKYGTSLRGITAIYQKDQQILVQLNVPDAVVDSQVDYLLHPSLMESISQASVGLLTDFSLSGLSSPPSFALDSLSIVSACTKNMYAWIRFAQGNTNDKACLDVDLCDQQGNVCVQMKGFSIPQLSVSIDLQVKQMMSMMNTMEETFTALVSSKPKQIKLAGLQDVTAPISSEHPIAPIKVSQRSLESVAKPLEINQPSFEKNALYSETQLYETALRASAVHEYLEIVESKQSTSESISQEQLQRQLATSLAEALYLSASDIDVEKSFIDLGLDSIVGVEWLNTINKKYKIAIPASVVYDYPTIGKMASFLHQELNCKGDVMQNITATSETLTSY
jgi:polyketide synthase PksN